MEKYLGVLQKCGLFQNIAPNDLPALMSCLGVKTESFDKKYTIFSEGNPARYIGIILSGSAHVTQIDFYGNRRIVRGIETGDVFGEAFACAGMESMPVSVIANEPCEVMLIDCNRILYTCANSCGFHQQLIFNLMKNLAVKNIQFHQKLEITSKRTTRDKLMAYLMSQAKKNGSNSFEIPFDRQELADFLEVDRSGLSSEISKLRNEGVLESNRKHFHLM